MASISLIMNGVKVCKMNCSYCSAVAACHPTKEDINDFHYDWNKTEETILNTSFIKKEIEEFAKNGKKPNISIDVWGMEPLENFEAFKMTVAFCEDILSKHFENVFIRTSTNGMSLRDDKVIQFLIDHNIHLQLSHDGCGQWIRSRQYEPLEANKDNIVKLVKEGILDLVNCTLSAKNPSFYDNINFWNKFRFENGLEKCKLEIKLNHIYDGTEPILKDNIGDLNFKGEVLNQYMHEFRELAIMFRDPEVTNTDEYRPYVSYILEQSKRWKELSSHEETNGACRMFQMGLSKETFAIDTTGRYCQCNLLDADHKVLDPSCTRPDYCKGCEYEMQSECHPCGSEVRAPECHFHKEWCRVLEEMKDIDMLLDKRKNLVIEGISNRFKEIMYDAAYMATNK